MNFLKKEEFICFLAWEGRKPIGFSEAMIRPYANGCEGRPVPFLEGLWLNPSHRRKGLGRELVDAIEVWASRRGFLELGSDAHMTAIFLIKPIEPMGFAKQSELYILESC